jgi:hypothetical protein
MAKVQDTTVGQKAGAGTYIVLEGGAHVALVAGGTVLVWEGASAAYVLTGEKLVEFAIAHPLAAQLLGIPTAAAINELSDGDDDEVRALDTLRQAYEGEVRQIGTEAEQRLQEGQSPESVARWAYQARRDIGIAYKDLTPPDIREAIYARNIEKYGDPLGPSIEWLLAQGKTWMDITESAARPGGADIVPKLLETVE